MSSRPGAADPIDKQDLAAGTPAGLADAVVRDEFSSDSVIAPLRYRTFRHIWLASLVSNLGTLIQGVVSHGP